MQSVRVRVCACACVSVVTGASIIRELHAQYYSNDGILAQRIPKPSVCLGMYAKTQSLASCVFEGLGRSR